MKPQTIKVIKYKDRDIYIRRFGNIFEYLLIFNNQIHTHYIDIKPVWYRKILFEEPYTKQQLDSIINLLIKGAQTAIDNLRQKYNAKA